MKLAFARILLCVFLGVVVTFVGGWADALLHSGFESRTSNSESNVRRFRWGWPQPALVAELHSPRNSDRLADALFGERIHLHHGIWLRDDPPATQVPSPMRVEVWPAAGEILPLGMDPAGAIADILFFGGLALGIVSIIARARSHRGPPVGLVVSSLAVGCIATVGVVVLSGYLSWPKNADPNIIDPERVLEIEFENEHRGARLVRSFSWGATVDTVTPFTGEGLLRRFGPWDVADESWRPRLNGTDAGAFAIEVDRCGHMPYRLRQVSLGWPARSLSCWLWYEAPGVAWTTDWSHGGAVLTAPSATLRDLRFLPLQPQPAGFLINSLFFASVYAGLISTIAGARSRRRMKRGMCPACGYDLRANDTGVCPECGAAAQRT